MSYKDVARFLRELATNSELRSAVVQFAAERGFEFTADELTDAQLDSVAGGKLTIGQPSDKLEKEADAVANNVVSGQKPAGG